MLFYPLFYFFLIVNPKEKVAHNLRKLWGRYLFFFSGIRTSTNIDTPLEDHNVYILVPNHSSYLDIPAVTVLLPHHFIFMAKNELAKIPFFRIFFKYLDIPVERKKAMAAHKSLLKAKAKIENGTSICIFPEGTIPANAPELARFKDGPFRLAIETGTSIVPITLPDNHQLLADNGKWQPKPGRMRMFVHRPIPTKNLNLSDVDALKQEVFNIIESKLKEYHESDR